MKTNGDEKQCGTCDWWESGDDGGCYFFLRCKEKRKYPAPAPFWFWDKLDGMVHVAEATKEDSGKNCRCWRKVL